MALTLIKEYGPDEGGKQLTRLAFVILLGLGLLIGSDLSDKKISGKFDGYSEAWSKSTFAVSSIKELMRMTEEFESE